MGAASSKIKEDKALRLCHERKKFVRQSLDGRCRLAATHIAYIEAVRGTGTALRKFVEPEAPANDSASTPVDAHMQTEHQSASQFSLYSESQSQRMDTTSIVSPAPSIFSSSRPQANRMDCEGSVSRRVEEKPSVQVSVSMTSSTSEKPTPHLTEGPEVMQCETPHLSPTSPPWDFFGLSHTIDSHFSSQERASAHPDLELDDMTEQQEKEMGVSDLESEGETSAVEEELQESEDDFDEPSAATVVQSFDDVNKTTDSFTSDLPPTPSAERVGLESQCITGGENRSPDLSPLRISPRHPSLLPTVKTRPIEEDSNEDKDTPKDLFSIMKDVEQLFIKASYSGREVPRMLEANKFHYRPILPGKEGGLLKSCFSCREDTSQVLEGPPQSSVKYLTWHRTVSSLSGSSRNVLGGNPIDDKEEFPSDMFDNFCMTAGSHESTLERLYAWEKKLYDEVKASEMVRREYDVKCKLLAQLESRAESPTKIDKTRAVIKDLHSRIRVAIERIDSISKKIEDLRDKELQPQLEELIEGLRRMWELMFECHKLQFHFISTASIPNNAGIIISPVSKGQLAVQLEKVLSTLAFSFSRWVGAQRAYVEFINNWLSKWVAPTQKSSRSKSSIQAPPLWKFGPPIYVVCGAWLEKIETLPTKEVVDSVKGLAAEISNMLPRQGKKSGKGVVDAGGGPGIEEPYQDKDISGFDGFHTSLAVFLGQLNKFAESSMKMYVELQKEIDSAKSSYKQS